MESRCLTTGRRGGRQCRGLIFRVLGSHWQPTPGALRIPNSEHLRRVRVGRGLVPRSPAAFLHVPGSTGADLLPDTAHRERRGEAGLLGQALISKGLFFPESSAVTVWIQV